MSVTPQLTRYRLPDDAYGRATWLEWQAGDAARLPGWTLHRDPLNQRDEPEKVGVLTDLQLEAIGHIMEGRRRAS